MGIYIDYTLKFRGEEEELLEKLNRVRHRVQSLPIERTSSLIRVQPVVSYAVLKAIDGLNLPIPPVVAEHLRPLREERELLRHCITLDSTFGFGVSKRLEGSWILPAVRLAEANEHWNPEDYPLWIRDGHVDFKFRTEALEHLPDREEEKFYGFTTNRASILMLFAQAMLSRGYVLYIDPGEGSETINLGLSTVGSGRRALWLGKGFTKTQYARDLQRAHTTVVRVLDLLQEEGLLHKASDNSGYYEDRDWPAARRRIAAELAVAGLFSGLTGRLVETALDLPEGTQIETLENNAGTAFDRLRDMGATMEEVAQGLRELDQEPEDPEHP